MTARRRRCSRSPAVVGETELTGRDFERQLELGYSGYVATDPSVGADGGALFAGLNSVSADGKAGKYYWAVSYRDEAARNLPYWTAAATEERLYDLAVDKTSHLDPRLTEIVRLTGARGISRKPMVFRDLELPGLPAGRVTLLGDAAHCMTPFRGEGGVHAMRDSLRLAQAIGQIDRDGAAADDVAVARLLAEYQDEMLARSVKAVRQSRGEWKSEPGQERVGWGVVSAVIPPPCTSRSTRYLSPRGTREGGWRLSLPFHAYYRSVCTRIKLGISCLSMSVDARL